MRLGYIAIAAAVIICVLPAEPMRGILTRLTPIREARAAEMPDMDMHFSASVRIIDPSQLWDCTADGYDFCQPVITLRVARTPMNATDFCVLMNVLTAEDCPGIGAMKKPAPDARTIFDPAPIAATAP